MPYGRGDRSCPNELAKLFFTVCLITPYTLDSGIVVERNGYLSKARFELCFSSGK